MWVPDERRTHILNGDTSGGGHRHSTGTPNKTEFPARWDDNAIGRYIVATARAPQQVTFLPEAGKRPDRWMCQADHDGVAVTAIVYPDGRVWTAWPEPGGRGVIRNEGTKS